ncbi:hypothetical protein FA13DRAFT_1737469 [Coprinellus micaceus]|jgi:receptor expression-enhancing protein 5/6|uniref:Protein YOP1 n=1 Tax=Coprinellus micaceus TaxID=71717 RepID=A0A4Y7SXE0_COPMI|nr:hypothetical protein FA13DRAFT_1737469 [Coprinellus micaceus]
MSSATQKLQQNPYVQQAQTKASVYINQLDKELTKYPVLNNLEQRTQIPKAYAVLGGLFFIVVLHSFNALAAPVSNLVGWGLPAYLSFKAIESPSSHDDVQWLTYWVVFGFFNFVESFALRLVLYYVPWYFAFKSAFIVWLQLPAFRGAQTIYFSLLKPVLLNLSSQNRSVAPVTTTTEHQE